MDQVQRIGISGGLCVTDRPNGATHVRLNGASKSGPFSTLDMG